MCVCVCQLDMHIVGRHYDCFIAFLNDQLMCGPRIGSLLCVQCVRYVVYRINNVVSLSRDGYLKLLCIQLVVVFRNKNCKYQEMKTANIQNQIVFFSNTLIF